MRKAKRHTLTVCAIVTAASCALLASGCVEVGIPASGDDNWGTLNPARGMHDQVSYKDQEPQPHATDEGGFEEGSMRVPPAQTAPVDTSPVSTAHRGVNAEAMANPVGINQESLRYGRLAYETTCVVCHGEDGQGEGYVVGEDKYPEPPSLTAQRARNFSDAELFEFITEGTGRMWGYDEQLYPMERWAVVNYIRALQRADSPEPQDRQLLGER